MDTPRWLTAIPIYNEVRTVLGVLDAVRAVSPEVLAVDDGSTDGTRDLLDSQPWLLRAYHAANLGYGAALATAFRYAVERDYDVLVTLDCDGQHEPARVPVLLEALSEGVDIVSGSRYLRDFRQDTPAPGDRRAINATITREVNSRYGLDLTDTFCGFKAYRVSALAKLNVTEPGWGMPLQLWVQAARLGLTIREVGVPRLYVDPNRTFGGGLDDAAKRLAHYRGVLSSAEASFPVPATPASCPVPIAGLC